MKIKTVVEVVPTVEQRKVKVTTVSLTEREALILRDILGAKSDATFVDFVLVNSSNLSKSKDETTLQREINQLRLGLNQFANERNTP